MRQGREQLWRQPREQRYFVSCEVPIYCWSGDGGGAVHRGAGWKSASDEFAAARVDQPFKASAAEWGLPGRIAAFVVCDGGSQVAHMGAVRQVHEKDHLGREFGSQLTLKQRVRLSGICEDCDVSDIPYGDRKGGGAGSHIRPNSFCSQRAVC